MRKLSIALLSGTILTFGCFSTARADVTIGTAGPMTGEYAQFGEQLKRGAQQACRRYQRQGRIVGQKLKLEVGDDACDPKQAVAVANKFASEGIKFVDGHFCSGSSIPASAVYQEENIIAMTPASTNPKLTDDAAAKGWKNVFRTCGRDDIQGVTAGNYLAAHFKDKKVAILDDKSPYGAGLARETEKNFEAKGGKPTLVDQITAGEKDYSALVGKLKAAGIDVIYFGGYHPEAGLIIRQAWEQGYKPQLISADALVTDEFWKISGPAGEGVMMTFAPDPRGVAGPKAVVAEFKKANYDPEGIRSTPMPRSKFMRRRSTRRAAGTIPRSRRRSMAILRHRVGKLNYDDKGDIIHPVYVLYLWHDGKYAEMK